MGQASSSDKRLAHRVERRFEGPKSRKSVPSVLTPCHRSMPLRLQAAGVYSGSIIGTNVLRVKVQVA